MDKKNNEFEVVIDFSKGGNPNRIFRSMADLLDTLQDLDSTLAEVVGVRVNNTLILEDIQRGSLKTIIRNFIQDLPDEDLRDANFKRILGHYLLKAKYIVLKWCKETPKLISPDQVEVLEGELLKAAEDSEINKIPAYSPPDRVKLLTNISAIQKSTRYLVNEDSVYYNCEEGSSQINNAIEISDSIVENVLTSEVIEDRSEAILKVKKADYLGSSKWMFKFEGHSIDVSITHSEWLDKFQNKMVSAQPGDSIRGTLVRYVSYGHNNEVLSVRYELEYVRQVIEAKAVKQAVFDEF